MRRKVSQGTVALIAAAAPLFLSLRAEAQTSSPENLAKGKALYDQGVALMEGKKYDAACPKFEEVIRLVPEGVGAKLTVAECYEADGRLARAYQSFKVAEEAAAKAGQAERQKKAHDRAAALEAKVSTLTITIPESTRKLDGLEVKLDGIAVQSDQFGVAMPVDGGAHRISVSAPKKTGWEKTVQVQPSGSKEVVQVAELSGAGGVGGAAVVEAPSAAPAPDATTGGAPLSGRRIAGIVLGASGIAALGAGAVAGVISINKRKASDEDGHCNAGNICDKAGIDLRDAAITAGNASTGFMIAGGALVAAGVVVFLTAPKAASPAASAELVVGPRGAWIRGAF